MLPGEGLVEPKMGEGFFPVTCSSERRFTRKAWEQELAVQRDQSL